jgi:hypothetical protein
MRGDIDTGVLVGNVTVGEGISGRTAGDFIIHSGYAGMMVFAALQGYGGHVHIQGDFTGTINVNGSMFGQIEIDGDMIAPCRLYFPTFLSRNEGGNPPNVHVHGSITGSVATAAPLIEVHNTLGGGNNWGTIAIDGSFLNAIENGHEIVTQRINHSQRGAIVIDYDGWDEGDDWEEGASIQEWDDDMVYHTYSSTDDPWVNVLEHGVFHITNCKGDLDNNGVVDNADLVAMDQARLLGLPAGDYRDCFVDHYAGLEGSVPWHGNLNCVDPADQDADCADYHWLEHLLAGPGLNCCTTDCAAIAICRADFDHSGLVDFGELTQFLTAYGHSEGDPLYNPLYDFSYGDCPELPEEQDCNNGGMTDVANIIHINDLTILLAAYGRFCECGGDSPAPNGPGGPDGGEDPEFVEWVRQATVEELLAWFEQWQRENP